jgi:hypothetical protein
MDTLNRKNPYGSYLANIVSIVLHLSADGRQLNQHDLGASLGEEGANATTTKAGLVSQKLHIGVVVRPTGTSRQGSI